MCFGDDSNDEITLKDPNFLNFKDIDIHTYCIMDRSSESIFIKKTSNGIEIDFLNIIEDAKLICVHM